jgi:hypothetical protein
MSKRFDKYFQKMDLILKNIVFHSKTFDEQLKIFDEIPFCFGKLTFWHYRLPFCFGKLTFWHFKPVSKCFKLLSKCFEPVLKCYELPFCTKIEGFRYSDLLPKYSDLPFCTKIEGLKYFAMNEKVSAIKR